MTHKSKISLAFTIAFIIFSITARAQHTGRDYDANSNSAQAEKQNNDHSAGKNIPFSTDDEKIPHGKVHAPHAEELPHIHKFHKERVKKIKKHHGKCWLMSQILLFLCHAAILYISYLHALH